MITFGSSCLHYCTSRISINIYYYTMFCCYNTLHNVQYTRTVHDVRRPVYSTVATRHPGGGVVRRYPRSLLSWRTRVQIPPCAVFAPTYNL